MESIRLLEAHPDWRIASASAEFDYVNSDGQLQPLHAVVAVRGGTEVHLHSKRLSGKWQLVGGFWRTSDNGDFLAPEQMEEFLARPDAG